MTISAVLITKNEEKDLPRCLKSLGFANEVVVVDSGSTDKTLEIAKKFDTKVYKRKFDNFASQRNFAISKAKGVWILSLDADEEIPQKLAIEILIATKSQEFDAYLIPRKNIIFGREIEYTRWSPDKHIWLFRKGKGKFKNSIHEEVDVSGAVGELENAKVHHSHKNVGDFLTMTNRYTELEAEELIKSGRKFSYLNLFYFPVRSFFGRYFIKQGFRDGWRGFTLSYLRAIYYFVLWVKVWEKS